MYSTHKTIGLFLGPITALVFYFLYTQQWVGHSGPVPLSPEGAAVISVTLFMSIWWLTEAVSISVTSLAPLILLPYLSIASMQNAASPYASPAVYLFLGGFIVARTFEKWSLHKRLAYWLIKKVGFSPVKLLGSFMLVPLILSMWMNNSSTTLLILPMVMVIIQTIEKQNEELNLNISANHMNQFKTFVCLSVCYSASLGGIGTPIGTAPNIILQGFLLERYGVEIDMILWLTFSIPLLLIVCPCLFVYMGYIRGKIHRINIPQEKVIEKIEKSRAELGPWTREQYIVLFIFMLTAFAWIFKSYLKTLLHLPYLNDASIAMTAAILFMALPIKLKSQQPFLMTWEEAQTLPWGVLMIIGGGMSLSAAIQSQGVSAYIGHQLLFIDGLSYMMVLCVLIPFISFSSEITSNAALTSAVLPIIAQLADTLNLDPIALLLPCVTAASMAFMLPSATPPNAIIYSTGFFTLPRMAKIGFFANIVAITSLILWSTFWYYNIFVLF